MEETARLTLAFIGEQEVHRNNARSLLDDFVDGWQKQHRKGEVMVVLTNERTDTIEDIEDWAATSGYDLVEETPGNVLTILLGTSDPRLILVGDPNDDDTLYAVAEEAAKYRIQTRSLINGLEKVVFDDDDFEDDMSGEGFHEVDVETDDGWADEDLTDEAAALLAAVPDVPDVPEDDAPVDMDLLAALADDGTVEAQEEIKNIAAGVDIDVAPFETWTDAVAAIRQGTTVVSEEMFEQLTEVSPDYVPDPPDLPELKGEDLQDAKDEETDDGYFDSGSSYTREQLEAMDFDKVKAIGVEIGLVPGRGYKKSVYVNKILLKTGVETEPPKRKRSRGKSKLEAVPTPSSQQSLDHLAGEAAEAKDADNTHGATITPIEDMVTMSGRSLQAMINDFRAMADQLEALLKD